MKENEIQLPDRNIDLREFGGLLFNEEQHSYHNAEGVKYTGMTTFLKPYEGSEFNSEETARYKAIKETISKNDLTKLKQSITTKLNIPSRISWTKVHLFYDKLTKTNIGNNIINKRQEILDEWNQSTIDGSIEHDRREKEVIENGYTWNGKHYPYSNKNILELTKDDCCVVPEIMVWDHDSELCGLADLPIFDKGVVHILDYKTNKKIDKSGFMGAKMKGVFSMHPDSKTSKYSAQLYGYQKMACDITGFKAGECWIISTKSEKYNRPKDIFIECIDMSKEIRKAFMLFKNNLKSKK